MKIAVLGTGTVGQTIADKLVELGHEVRMGARDAVNEAAAGWAKKAGAKASAGSFADAAGFGELVINATKGAHSLDALRAAGSDRLANKVLLDVSNPLDFSAGFPPSLTVCNTDSLGEQVQREFPNTRVVKGLNTMWCGLMVNPRMLSESHNTFISGNDDGAKDQVKDLLRSFGWKDEEIVDLGDITTARGTESYLPLWVRIYGATDNGAFNIKLVAAPK